MDFFAKLELGLQPRIRYAPILWEPLEATGERFVALIAVEPVEVKAKSLFDLNPGAYITIRRSAVPLLTGAAKSSNAASMLEVTRDFLSEQLESGIGIDKLLLPFEGFYLGQSKLAQGSSMAQLLDIAVANSTILSDGANLWDESSLDVTSSASTRYFLRNLKSHFSLNDPSRKERFDIKLELHDGPSITLDYAYKKWMVQVTSLPNSTRQAPNVQREGESKLFHLEAIRDEFGSNPVTTRLVVNENSGIDAHAGREIKDLRDEAVSRLRYFAKKSATEIVLVRNSEDGLAVFETMN